MLLLDQRTLQIKYRIPASEIYRMSLSPYVDDIAVFHVKAVSDFFGELRTRKQYSLLSVDACLEYLCAIITKRDLTGRTAYQTSPFSRNFVIIARKLSRQTSRPLLMYLEDACFK